MLASPFISLRFEQLQDNKPEPQFPLSKKRRCAIVINDGQPGCDSPIELVRNHIILLHKPVWTTISQVIRESQ
ncbi:ATP-dependent DNA helicase RecQ [Fusarium oxysporum f. sp. albedinis]|nr:ATP-dependent DNA helicase RecQ [Fusarium oxysporum f. sp. albedinis]